jgi:hypothetical protein
MPRAVVIDRKIYRTPGSDVDEQRDKRQRERGYKRAAT